MSASPRKSTHGGGQAAAIAALPGYYGKGEPYLTLFSTKYNKPSIDKLKRPDPRRNTSLAFTSSGTIISSKAADVLSESGGAGSPRNGRLSRQDSLNTSRSVMSSYHFGEVSLTPRDMVAPVAIIVGKGAGGSSSASTSTERPERGPLPNPKGPGARVVASSAPAPAQRQQQQQQPVPVVEPQHKTTTGALVVSVSSQQFQALEINETNDRTLVRIQETGARKLLASMDEVQLDQVVVGSNIYIDEHQARHRLYLEFFESRGRAFIRSEARKIRMSLHIETSEFVHRLWIRQRVRNCWHRFAAETQRSHLMLSESKKRLKLQAVEQEAFLFLISGPLESDARSSLQDREADTRRLLIIVEADEQGAIKKMGNSNVSLSSHNTSYGTRTPVGTTGVVNASSPHAAISTQMGQSTIHPEPQPPKPVSPTVLKAPNSAADLALLDSGSNQNGEDIDARQVVSVNSINEASTLSAKSSDTNMPVVVGGPLPTEQQQQPPEEGRSSAGSNHSNKSNGTGSSRNKFTTRTTANTNTVVVASGTGVAGKEGLRRDSATSAAAAGASSTAESSRSIQLFVAPAGEEQDQHSVSVVDSKNASTMNPINGSVARGMANKSAGVTNAPERSAFGENSVESLKTPNSQNSFHPNSTSRRDSAEQSASRSNFSINSSIHSSGPVRGVERSIDNPQQLPLTDNNNNNSNTTFGVQTEVSIHPQSTDSISTGMWGPGSSQVTRPGAPSRDLSLGSTTMGLGANQSDWYGDSADSSQLYYSAHSSAYMTAAGSSASGGPNPQQIAQIRAMQEEAHQRLMARRREQQQELRVRSGSNSGGGTPPTDSKSPQQQQPQQWQQQPTPTSASGAPVQEQGTPLVGSMRKSPSSRRSPQRHSNTAIANGSSSTNPPDPGQQEMVILGATGQPPTGRARRATPPVVAQISKVPIASTDSYQVGSATTSAAAAEPQRQEAQSASVVPVSNGATSLPTNSTTTTSVGIMCTGNSFNSQSSNMGTLVLGGGAQQQQPPQPQQQVTTASVGVGSTPEATPEASRASSFSRQYNNQQQSGVPTSILKSNSSRSTQGSSGNQAEVRSGGESSTASPTAKNGGPVPLEQEEEDEAPTVVPSKYPIVIRLRDSEQQTDEQRIDEEDSRKDSRGRSRGGADSRQEEEYYYHHQEEVERIPRHRPPPSPAQDSHYRRSTSPRNTGAGRPGSRQQTARQPVRRPHSGLQRGQQARARKQQHQGRLKRRSEEFEAEDEADFIQNDDDITTTTTAGSDDYHYYEDHYYYPKYRGGDEEDEEIMTPLAKNPSRNSRPPSSGGRRRYEETSQPGRSASKTTRKRGSGYPSPLREVTSPRTPSQQKDYRRGDSRASVQRRPPSTEEPEEYSEYEELRKKHPLHYPKGQSIHQRSKPSPRFSPPRMPEDDIGMLDLYAKVIKSLSNRPSTVELPNVLAQMREPKMRSVQEANFIFSNAVLQPHSPSDPPQSSSSRGAFTSPRPHARGSSAMSSRPQSATTRKTAVPSSSVHPQHQGRTFKHLNQSGRNSGRGRGSTASPISSSPSTQQRANSRERHDHNYRNSMSGSTAVLFDMPDLDIMEV